MQAGKPAFYIRNLLSPADGAGRFLRDSLPGRVMALQVKHCLNNRIVAEAPDARLAASPLSSLAPLAAE